MLSKQMKNFLLVVALGLAVFCAIVAFATHSKVDKIEKSCLDTTTVLKLSKSEPTFTSVNDVLQYQQESLLQMEVDSVFNQLEQKTLIDVSTVLLNKGTKCTKKAIVDEFLMNKSVYTNLPQNTNNEVNETPPNKADSTNSSAVYTSVQYKDTVINGNAAKAEITTRVIPIN